MEIGTWPTQLNFVIKPNGSSKHLHTVPRVRAGDRKESQDSQARGWGPSWLIRWGAHPTHAPPAATVLSHPGP